MKKERTKDRILKEAVKLFAKEGYEAVSVEQIATAVGIKAPSLYKHYSSKRDIFESILRVMEQKDAENASSCSLPEGSAEAMPEAYKAALQQGPDSLIAFSRLQFRYWTEDEFASNFRKMITIEQYRSGEMAALYHQYLGSGPLEYAAELIGSREEALEFYAPMHLLYSLSDRAGGNDEALALLEAHFARFKEEK